LIVKARVGRRGVREASCKICINGRVVVVVGGRSSLMFLIDGVSFESC
jgi:hypothetical protein